MYWEFTKDLEKVEFDEKCLFPSVFWVAVTSAKLKKLFLGKFFKSLSCLYHADRRYLDFGFFEKSGKAAGIGKLQRIWKKSNSMKNACSHRCSGWL